MDSINSEDDHRPLRRDYLFHSFFLAVFLYLIFQFFLIIRPFLTPILGATVLAVLAHPLHRRLVRLFPKRGAGFLTFFSTVITLAVIVIPFFLIFWLLFNESQSMGPWIHEWADTLRTWRRQSTFTAVPWVHSLQISLDRIVGAGQIDFEAALANLASEFFDSIGNAGRSLARNTVLSLWQIFVMGFVLFFLLRDGDYFILSLQRLIPMRLAHKQHIVSRLRVTVTEIVRGSILTALIQTLCATAGYYMIRSPAAVTLGVVTGIASFIPIFGSALIWFPLALIYVSKGQYGKGIFIFLWGTLVISTLDNLLRTVLIGRKAKLPLLFLFFGILGGAELYGLKGLLIGPLLVAIIPVFIEIYRDQYLRKDRLDLPEESREPV